MSKRLNRLALVTGVVLLIVAMGATRGSHRDVEEMTTAASALLEALTPEQRARATFAFDSAERFRFHFIPIEMFERQGVMLKEMSPDQLEASHALLQAALSQDGYLTAVQIMELEDVLLALEGGQRFARDRDEYLFSFFGVPSAGETWAWRFEGHHISLHFTIVGGEVAVGSPAFVGANPAEVRDGPQRGRRPLGDREDTGRSLMLALDDAQRSEALIAVEAPRDIFTGAEAEVDPLDPIGLRASEMTEPQKELLLDVIPTYLAMMSDDIAARRMLAIMETGLEPVSFAWAGGLEPGEGHYYRVQGPSFLIEYDNVQNGANHIHSVWRDFDGDFGRDLIREHRARHPHD